MRTNFLVMACGAFVACGKTTQANIRLGTTPAAEQSALNSAPASETYYVGTNVGFDTEDDHDDEMSPEVALGFSFTYYGTAYMRRSRRPPNRLTLLRRWRHGAIYEPNFARQPSKETASPFFGTTLPLCRLHAGPRDFVQDGRRGRLAHDDRAVDQRRLLRLERSHGNVFGDPLRGLERGQGAVSPVAHPRRLADSGGHNSLGASATIGIENSAGTSAIQYSYNSNVLSDWMAITYTPCAGTNCYTQNAAAAYEPVLLGDCASPPPDLATLTSPDAGGLVSTTPTFQWNTVSNATSYRLVVSTDSSLNDTVVDVSGLTAASDTLTSALGANTLYYWAIVSENACGATLVGGARLQYGQRPTAGRRRANGVGARGERHDHHARRFER